MRAYWRDWNCWDGRRSLARILFVRFTLIQSRRRSEECLLLLEKSGHMMLCRKGRDLKSLLHNMDVLEFKKTDVCLAYN